MNVQATRVAVARHGRQAPGRLLQGRAGGDILIGGLGADTLDGGADDDILIGGKTTNDAVISKPNDLRTE